MIFKDLVNCYCNSSSFCFISLSSDSKERVSFSDLRFGFSIFGSFLFKSSRSARASASFVLSSIFWRCSCFLSFLYSLRCLMFGREMLATLRTFLGE